MYILHQGPGFYANQPFTNPTNPLRRDTQLVQPGGHLVVQYEADNPGVWPFHCHIAWHLSLVSSSFLTSSRSTSFPQNIIKKEKKKEEMKEKRNSRRKGKADRTEILGPLYEYRGTTG